jgi:Kef-type K+ transport system membrane component KefB
VLLVLTSGLMAALFMAYYNTNFNQALIHAIPLSVISSAIAIPSVQNMDAEKKEFVIYESTFSDILGIIAFNYFVMDHSSGVSALLGFSWDLILILIISIVSTVALVLLLNHATTHVRFFLTFSIIILAYSIAKYLHLPSLFLVLCFGLVLNNFKLFDYPQVHKFLSFNKLNDVTKELKLMTAETAFIIRTFFFLLFGYSLNMSLLKSQDVIIVGLLIIALTIFLRFIFLKFLLKVDSTPLSLIAPRGLITILLFYSIPKEQRLAELSEGVLFIVIVLTGLSMTIGLLLTKQSPKEKIEDVI